MNPITVITVIVSSITDFGQKLANITPQRLVAAGLVLNKFGRPTGDYELQYVERDAFDRARINFVPTTGVSYLSNVELAQHAEQTDVCIVGTTTKDTQVIQSTYFVDMIDKLNGWLPKFKVAKGMPFSVALLAPNFTATRKENGALASYIPLERYGFTAIREGKGAGWSNYLAIDAFVGRFDVVLKDNVTSVLVKPCFHLDVTDKANGRILYTCENEVKAIAFSTLMDVLGATKATWVDEIKGICPSLDLIPDHVQKLYVADLPITGMSRTAGGHLVINLLGKKTATTNVVLDITGEEIKAISDVMAIDANGFPIGMVGTELWASQTVHPTNLAGSSIDFDAKAGKAFTAAAGSLQMA